MSASDLEGIAIIGMAARFPGANSVARFWANLKNAVESISRFSDEELSASGVGREEMKKPNYVRARGILEDAEMFDAAFFGFNPREAQVIDPQHRVFLECAYQALEDSGYDANTYTGSIGVYAGTSLSNYLFHLFAAGSVIELVGGVQAEIGNDKDFLATRVSYKLNLRGPSINVNTACSTSLVAAAIACQSLMHYQCDIALAGGVSISIPQKAGYLYQEGGINSADGHCRAFDAGAQGTVGGNGVGVVVLKRLAEALAAGDHIYAVIKGSAINNDGSLKIGYTAPSENGQAEVIALAQALAGVAPETISYIETHGTATPLGDPIEMAALIKAFRSRTRKKNFCAIGSVKSNIGHLDAAAGIAGLIKTALSLKHKMLPPSLHFEQPNPKIDFANSPFYVNTKLQEWRTKGTPRRAGVSSFGIGGTNAHLVLEEAPELLPSGEARAWQLLLLSAKTATALEHMTGNLLEYLEQNSDAKLADIAYTLQNGRRALAHRAAVVARHREGAIEALRAGRVARSITELKRRPVVFLFPGQGTQYVYMGKELYEQESRFREVVDRGAERLKEELGLDLRDILYPVAGEEQQASARLEQTAITQPALYVIEYALAQMLMEWTGKPEAMIGHSLGEYVAATLAGVMSFEDGLRLVATRGRLMQEIAGGAMLSVAMAEDQARELLREGVSLAAVNGEAMCTLSGAEGDIAGVEEGLQRRGIWHRRLKTSHAFHSQMMEPMIGRFAQELARVKLEAPKIPYVSNLTGTWITASEARDVAYWTRHLRQTVRFAEGMQELARQGDRIFLEVGPGKALSGIARQFLQEQTATILPVLRAAQSLQSDMEVLTSALGSLWLAGATIDWASYYDGQRRRRLSMPTYPFERQRYWVEATYLNAAPSSGESASNARPDLADWFYVPSWKQSVPPRLLGAGDFSAQGLCWLLLVDALGVGERLAKRLEQEGQEVIVVEAGERFRKKSERRFVVNPRTREPFDALLKDLCEQGRVPQKIIHLWNVTTQEQMSGGERGFDDRQNSGFFSLLFLGQALKEAPQPSLVQPFEIVVISNDLQAVTGDEKLRPDKACLLAACKIIPQEFANITCRSIDVRVGKSAASRRELGDRLLAELVAERAEAVVAYRRNSRWVQTLEPVRMNGSTRPHARLKPDSVYLITGGLEAFGIKLAAYLGEAVQAKLVLVTSAQLPERNHWDLYLAVHPKNDEISRKLRKLRAIEELGTEIVVLKADTTDEAQMRAVVAEARRRFGDLHGVIHAEDAVRQRPMLAIDAIRPDECRFQVQRKALALEVLDTVLQGLELDFCILLSSLTPILGGPGLIAHSAANALQDAFARKRHQAAGKGWMTLNWELKADASGVEADDIFAPLAITPAESLDAFSRVLSMGEVAQVIVSAANLKQGVERWHQREPVEVALADGGSRTTTQQTMSHPRPNLQTAYVAPHNDMERFIAELWQELLGLAEVGVEDDFFELGGHSLLAIQLLLRLREKFQVGLQINDLLQPVTVAGLAKQIGEAAGTHQARSSVITLLQPKGDGTPFFCVHPVGGSAMCFLDLSRLLGEDRPFYGLQARELADIGEHGDPYNKLEEMAAYYLKAVRGVQEQGPYLLGGFSWGSIVAFEMAQQLREQGEEVPLLAIIDTPSPDIVGKIATLDETVMLLIIARDLAHQRGIDLPVSVTELNRLDHRERFTLVLKQLKDARILPEGMDLTWFRRHLQGYKARMSAVRDYQPRPYPGRLTLLRTLETDAEVDPYLERMQDGLGDPSFGWGKLSGEPVEVYELTGNHSVILLKPHVQVLAERLRACLARTGKECL